MVWRKINAGISLKDTRLSRDIFHHFVQNAFVWKLTFSISILLRFRRAQNFQFSFNKFFKFCSEKTHIQEILPVLMYCRANLLLFSEKKRIYSLVNVFLFVQLFPSQYTPVEALAPSLPLSWQRTSHFISRTVACNFQISMKQTWMLDEWISFHTEYDRKKINGSTHVICTTLTLTQNKKILIKALTLKISSSMSANLTTFFSWKLESA